MIFKQGNSAETVAATYTTKIAGIWSAMGLFDPHLQKARELGFDRACELLTKEALSDIENRLLTAIHWAGQAGANSAVKHVYHKELDAEREQSFLFYAICLESLFCKRHEAEEVTERLSRRCARLLGTDTLEQESIYRDVKELYNRRSDIVHEGGLRVSAKELTDIRIYTCDSLIKMLTDDELLAMNNAAFEQWFRN